MTKESKELTVDDRARQVLKFDETKKRLADLAVISKPIVAVDSAESREECHAATMRLANMRVTIEKAGKEGREDANKYAKAVIAVEKELIAIISPEETRLRGMRDKWDGARAAEKAERERIEAKKISDDNAGLERIRDIAVHAIGKTSTELAAVIEGTESIDLSTFNSDDARERASELIKTTLDRLRTMRDGQKALEDANAARAAQEAADREKRESAAKAAEEADREARVKREADETAQRAEQKRKDDAEREEQDRIAAARRKELDEQADRQRAEQARIDEANRKLEAERKEKARKDEEASAAAEREAKEKAHLARLAKLRGEAGTLTDCAIDAVAFLSSHGFADEDVTVKLGFAIEKANKRKLANAA